MKNELVTKEVEFDGNVIIASQDVTTGKVYVGVRWVCEGIGLSVDQIKNERKRINKDLVLSKGGSNLTLPTNGGEQDVLVLELDFLPLWLAKISITPTMIRENPDVTQKLINYQLKAKDVLAKAFIHNDNVTIDNFHIPRTLSEALLLSANLAKENEEMKPKAEQFDLYLESTGLLSMNQSSKELKARRNKFMQFLRYMKVLNQDNSPSDYYANKDYFVVKSFVIIKRNNKKYSVAITYVTPKGQDFLFRYLKKHKDIYAKFDKKYLSRLLEVSANA